MVDGSTTAIGEETLASAETSPKRLLHEALSLGIVLVASLVLSRLEHLGQVPWLGYPSSLLLLALGWWHKRRFGIAVSLSPSRPGGRTFPVLFSLGLVGLLLASAHAPLWPESGRGSLVLLQSLHLLLLVPLSEEFYFRGLLFDHLRRGFSAARAVVLCSLLFALLHLPTGGSLGAAVLSLLACLLVLKNGGWVYALQLHIAFNGLSQINRLGDSSSRWFLGLFVSTVIAAFALTAVSRPRGQSTGDRTR